MTSDRDWAAMRIALLEGSASIEPRHRDLADWTILERTWPAIPAPAWVHDSWVCAVCGAYGNEDCNQERHQL